MTKAKVAPQGKPKNSNDLKQRLEIAAMLLQLAQDVPALVPEAGCHIKLKGELLKIQKCISKGNKSTPKGCSKTLKPRSTGKHGQKRKHVDSLDSGLVMGPEWTAARDKEDMFFPNLEDSSLMAEVDHHHLAAHVRKLKNIYIFDVELFFRNKLMSFSRFTWAGQREEKEGS